MKKAYAKPALKTRKVELGVFGDYSSDKGPSGRGSTPPSPVDVIRDLNLHME